MGKALTCATALFGFIGIGTLESHAVSVGASGTTSIYWNLDSATDRDGNTVDGTGTYAETGNSSLSVSAGVNAVNTTNSTGILSAIYTIKNITTDVFISWSATSETQVSAGAFIEENLLGDYYYDANVNLGPAFAAVTGFYLCSNLDPNSPTYNCFGASDGNGDGVYDSLFGSLAPGESISFSLEGSAFATLRYAPITTIPIPGAAMLLLTGLVGLGAARTRLKHQPQQA